MKSSKKGGLVVLFVIGVSIFGYSQYASASQIEVNVIQSELLHEDENAGQTMILNCNLKILHY